MSKSYRLIASRLYDPTHSRRHAINAYRTEEAVARGQIAGTIALTVATAPLIPPTNTVPLTAIMQNVLPGYALVQGIFSIGHGVMAILDKDHLGTIHGLDKEELDNEDDGLGADVDESVPTEVGADDEYPAEDDVWTTQIERERKKDLDAKVHENWAPLRNKARGVFEIISGVYLSGGINIGAKILFDTDISLGPTDLYFRFAAYSFSQLLLALGDFYSYYKISEVNREGSKVLDAYWYKTVSMILGTALSTMGWLVLAAADEAVKNYSCLFFCWRGGYYG